MNYCDEIAKKVKTTEVWKKEHLAHSDGDYRTGKFEHPSGEWYWLVCPCGAMHLCSESQEGK